MAVLSDTDRFDIWVEFMRDKILTDCSITKQQLRTLVNDADTWVDSNRTSYNNSLSQPGRNALSAAEKAAILAYVVAKRWPLEV